MTAAKHSPQAQNGQGVSPLVMSLQQGSWGVPQANVLPRPSQLFTEGQFGPSEPIIPMPIDVPDRDGTVEPRRVEYPVAWNLPVGVPGSEGLGKLASFNTLRAFADRVSPLRAAIDKRVLELQGLDWDIVPTKQAAEAMKGSATAKADWQRRYGQMMDFWERPDRSPDSPYENWEEWANAVFEDNLVIDAVSFYLRPPLGGRGRGWFGSQVASLDTIDGSTIRPLYALLGGRPSPSAVAYQQYLWGVPRSDFATIAEGRDIKDLPDYDDQFARSELLYIRTWPRTWAPYGQSVVEKCLLPAAITLARQTQQLEYYTEGTVPYTYVIAGQDISTPQQIRMFQNALNQIAGDTGWKQKVVVLPFGSKTEAMKPYDLADQFDYYLISLLTMPLGLTPQDVGAIPNMGGGSSAFSYESAKVAGMSQSDAKDRWLEPMCNKWTRIFNKIIQGVFGQHDMQWHWTGLEQGEDADDLIQQQVSLFQAGIKTLDESRAELGLDPFEAYWSQIPMVSTASGVMSIVTAAESAEQQLQQARDPEAGTPSTEGRQLDRRGQPDSPTHAAARQVHKPADGQAGAGTRPSGRGGNAVSKTADVEVVAPNLREVRSELEILGRQLRKGVAFDDFRFDHCPLAVQSAVKAALGRGVDAGIDAGLVAAMVVQPAVEKKRPKAAGVMLRAGDTGRVLMVQRDMSPDDDCAGLWEWPGGHVDGDEHAWGAAQREFGEEVGAPLPFGRCMAEYDKGRYRAFLVQIPHEADFPIPESREKGEVKAVRWWHPDDISGNEQMRPELRDDDDWRVVLPKAPKLPWHLRTDADLRLVAHWEPIISAALRAPELTGEIRQAVVEALAAVGPLEQAVSNVSKDHSVNKPTNLIKRIIRAILDRILNLLPGKMRAMLRSLWTDSAVIGAWSAAAHSDIPLPPGAPEGDWWQWRPGDYAAANLTAWGGLRHLLEQADTVIQGVDDTTLDRVGNAIAAGLVAGDTPEVIAQRVADVLGSPARASMIARTEVSRAMSHAAFDTMRQAGTAMWWWKDFPGACATCQTYAAGGPYVVGATPTPPAHPHCRCFPEPAGS